MKVKAPFVRGRIIFNTLSSRTETDVKRKTASCFTWKILEYVVINIKLEEPLIDQMFCLLV